MPSTGSVVVIGGTSGLGTEVTRRYARQDVTAAVVALLENPGINGVDVYVDGGWVLL